MGGGTSRFDETDWETATGKLTSSGETIDGRPPTSRYGVYYITKQGLNQRDFDVTDENANLLYSTKYIEGTLAWFDVLGPGLEEYLLRVQVDLSRRYWVIYRFEKPTYTGQFADMTATMNLRESRGQDQPCLYKRACITVTWSRYHAIVNEYGPPPEKPTVDTDLDESSGEPPLWASPAHGSQSSLSPGVEETKDGGDHAAEHFQDLVEPGVEEAKEEVHDVVRRLQQMPSLLDTEESLSPQAKDPFVTATVDGVPDGPNGALVIDTTDRGFSYDMQETPKFDSEAVEIMECKKKKKKSKLKELKEWVKDASGANDPPPNPLEGYLLLDKPIIKCEEINSFMGQHQTMLVGDNEAEELLQEELAAAAESGTDAHNPNANMNLRVNTTSKPERDEKELSITAGIEKTDSISPSNDGKAFPRMRKLAKWMKAQSQKVTESGHKWTTGATSCDSGSQRNIDQILNEPETETRETVAQNRARTASEVSNLSLSGPGVSRNNSVSNLSHSAPGMSRENSTGDFSLNSGKSSSNRQLEPLVGFWNWDNTMRVHKMKMHIAKGSDLALHVVLAIVTNQLRLERNVVVSSV